MYYDANLFVDVSPSMRLTLSYQHIGQVFVADNGKEKNERHELSGLFFFQIRRGTAHAGRAHLRQREL